MSLEHLDKALLALVHDKTRSGKYQRIAFDGARTHSVAAAATKVRAMTNHQDAMGFCNLNALHAVYPLPAELYAEIREKGPVFPLHKTAMSMRCFLNNKKKTPVKLARIRGVQRCNLLSHILSLCEGLFIIKFRGHCVGYDASTHLFYTTNPCYPPTVQYEGVNTLEYLDIDELEVALRVVRTKK